MGFFTIDSNVPGYLNGCDKSGNMLMTWVFYQPRHVCRVIDLWAKVADVITIYSDGTVRQWDFAIRFLLGTQHDLFGFK